MGPSDKSPASPVSALDWGSPPVTNGGLLFPPSAPAESNRDANNSLLQQAGQQALELLGEKHGFMPRVVLEAFEHNRNLNAIDTML